MHELHLIGGDKGGAGKSFVCRTMVQYHLDNKIDFALYDADRCNADVARIYSDVGCKKIILSEGREYQDGGNEAYLSALEKPTIVNLPAQVMNSLDNWFKKNNLFAMAQDDGIEIYIWFICNGQKDSIDILGEYFQRFKSNVKYILVKNEGVCDDWKTLDNLKSDSGTGENIKGYNVKKILFPELYGDNAISMMDKKSLTFEQAKNHKDFSLFDRRRVRTFLEKAYEVFNETEVFQCKSKESTEESTEESKSGENEKKGFKKPERKPEVVNNASS